MKKFTISNKRKLSKYMSYLVVLMSGIFLGLTIKTPFDVVKYGMIFSIGFWTDEIIGRLTDWIYTILRGF